jgi:glycosyltransferase involved in cell wall biosynthesis
VPRTKYAYTINQSYANLFRAKYNTSFQIIRNASVLKALELPKTKEKPYILYQGAVNVGRGIEEMIQAMPYINNCELYICGNGDVYDACVSLVKQLNLEEKVHFFGFVEPDKLRTFTLNATLGFTFFTKQGISYHLSLANRFFDYFHNGVPQLCVNYPEYKSINQQYEIAVLVNNLKPKNIAEKVNDLLQDKKRYEKLKANCLEARKYINWQEEEKKLIAFYENIK